MSVNRVIYDQNRVVVAIHPVEQTIDLAAYARDGRILSTLVATTEDVPGVMVEEREVLRDEHGSVRVDGLGQPLLGRAVDLKPRVLDAAWIAAHVAPVVEVIDGTAGKLALLEADHLDAVTDAIAAIADAKARRAAQLKFDASTWRRSDPLWDELGTAAGVSAAAIDACWRAAAA